MGSPPPVLDYSPPAERRRTAGTAVAAAIVFAAHCVLQFVLYRGRSINRWPICDSDLFVFGLPLLVAFGAYAFIFAVYAKSLSVSTTRRIYFVAKMTLVVGFFSWWMSMLIPLNTYGE
jgi:hypothetical protein